MKAFSHVLNAPKVVRERPYVRAAIVVGIGSILLLAVTMPLLTPASADSRRIHATGSLSTTVAYDLNSATVGGSTVVTRATVATYNGTLTGTATGLFEIITKGQSTAGVSTNVFIGTVGDSAPGTFSYISTQAGDFSPCPCPPGITTLHSTIVIVAGSGHDGLAGICGGGTFTSSGNPVMGFTSTYDLTIQFGDSCHSQG